jgi:hypothetical protein
MQRLLPWRYPIALPTTGSSCTWYVVTSLLVPTHVASFFLPDLPAHGCVARQKSYATARVPKLTSRIDQDYDCFYASVIENQRPELKGKPVAVKQKQVRPPKPLAYDSTRLLARLIVCQLRLTSS